MWGAEIAFSIALWGGGIRKNWHFNYWFSRCLSSAHLPQLLHAHKEQKRTEFPRSEASSVNNKVVPPPSQGHNYVADHLWEAGAHAQEGDSYQAVPARSLVAQEKEQNQELLNPSQSFSSTVYTLYTICSLSPSSNSLIPLWKLLKRRFEVSKKC